MGLKILERKTGSIKEAEPYLYAFKEKWFALVKIDQDFEKRKDEFKNLVEREFGPDALKLGLVKLILSEPFDYEKDEVDFVDKRIFNFIKDYLQGE